MKKVSKPRKTNKYVFTLKNVNIEQVDKKFNITITSNIENSLQPTNTTKLSDLSHDKSLDIVSFLDETKRTYHCNVSMIDWETGENILKSSGGYNCFWCRHPFETAPIGCPLKYVANNVIKNYYSEITKDKYTIKEKIARSKGDIKEKGITIENKAYYSSDGIFCSFNCCKAFIKDNKHNQIYNFSENLLVKLYFDMNMPKDKNLKEEYNSILIESAPHWRLLKEYGGYLTIDKFREKFNKVVYKCHGVIDPEPIFKPTAFVFEETIKF